jgi:hypothetical protein
LDVPYDVVMLLEEFGPGDAAIIPPGHNAWGIGDKPVVGIDFTGLKEYAKS